MIDINWEWILWALDVWNLRCKANAKVLGILISYSTKVAWELINSDVIPLTMASSEVSLGIYHMYSKYKNIYTSTSSWSYHTINIKY
jgi:hypothetical protein